MRIWEDRASQMSRGNKLLPLEGERETTRGSGREQPMAVPLQLGHLLLEGLSTAVQEVIP